MYLYYCAWAIRHSVKATMQLKDQSTWQCIMCSVGLQHEPPKIVMLK